MANQLMFHSTAVQSFNHNNQIWITSTELSKLLKYSDSKSVTKIYSRNSDEFTNKMTMVVKLTTNGINNSLREKSVRIFSLRGAHLIAMFANTEVAKEVRKWLLDLADKEMGVSETISLEQQQAIQQAVNERVYRTGERHQAIYSRLHQQFKIPRYQDLPASKFDEAIKWLGGVHSRSGLSDEDWYDLAWLYKAAERMRYQIELIEPALRVIDSGFRGNFYSMAREYKRVLYSAKVIIERETAHIKAKNIIDKWNNVLPVIRHA